MLLFQAERLFGLEPLLNCEDSGLIETRNMFNEDPSNIWFILLWVPIGMATGNVEYLFGRLWDEGFSFRKGTGINPIILTGWVTFTFLSLLSLLQFGRAPISFIVKFIHVAFELSNVVTYFFSWGWTGHALATIILAITGLFATFGMPCKMLYELTSIGAVLDTLNIILCVLAFRRNRAFFLSTIGFFFHATYIWAFLIMSYAVTQPLVIVLLRLYGVVANALSIHFGTGAIDAVLRKRCSCSAPWWILSMVGFSIRDSHIGRDARLFSSTQESYIVPSIGMEVPRTGESILFLLGALLTPGMLYVKTTENSQTVMNSFGTVMKAGGICWSEDTWTVSSWTIRLGKIMSWILFYLVLQALMLVTSFVIAFFVAWYLPVVLSAMFMSSAHWIRYLRTRRV